MNKQIKLIYLLSVFVSSLFIACDSDELAVGTKLYPEEQIDMNTPKVYISKELYPLDNVTMTLYETPFEIIKPKNDTISFSVKLSKVLDKDVIVTLGGNPSLVEEYNNANKTSFEALSDGAIKILTPTVTIKAGMQKSLETVKAVINYDNLSDLKESGLGCIVVKEVSEGVKIAKNFNVINLILNKKYQNIKTEGSLNDAEEVDKGIYNLTAGSTYDGRRFGASNAMDGSLQTSWVARRIPTYLQFDLSELTEVKGVRTFPFYYSDNSLNVKELEVFTSLDGKEWKSQGTFKVPFPNAKDPIDICFYSSVKTKYLKLDIIDSYSWTCGYSEVILMK